MLKYFKEETERLIERNEPGHIDMATQNICWAIAHKHLNAAIDDSDYASHLIQTAFDITHIMRMSYDSAIEYVENLPLDVSEFSFNKH